jgi:hypothetical protein
MGEQQFDIPTFGLSQERHQVYPVGMRVKGFSPLRLSLVSQPANVAETHPLI